MKISTPSKSPILRHRRSVTEHYRDNFYTFTPFDAYCINCLHKKDFSNKIQGIRSWSETGESRHRQLIAISLFISFEYQFLTQVDMELGSSFSVIRIV